MASALMRRSVLTAALAAIATVASPLATNAFAVAPPLTSPTVAPANGATVAANKPAISAKYNTALNKATSTLHVTDTSAGNAAVTCPVVFTNSDSTIGCTPSSDLVDGHAYKVTVHAENTDSSSKNDVTATWTVDIPSLVTSSPLNGTTVPSAQTISATYDESVDATGHSTAALVSSDGAHVPGVVQFGKSSNSAPSNDTIKFVADQSLPDGTYTASFHVDGVTPPLVPLGSPTDNPNAFADTVVHFVVDHDMPSFGPFNIISPPYINQANEAAVPFSGYAQPGYKVGVAIYNESAETGNPKPKEGFGPQDGFNSVVVGTCTDDDAKTDTHSDRGCPWSLTVNMTGKKDADLQWYAYSFSAAGQVPAKACPSASVANGCPQADPTITKDTVGPSAPVGGSDSISVNTVTVSGATDPADSDLDHYRIVVSDDQGHSATKDGVSPSGVNNALPSTTVDASGLDDGAVHVNVFGVDAFGNLSDGDDVGDVSKSSVTIARAPVSADTVSAGSSSYNFTNLTSGKTIKTPTSITVYFNEPITLAEIDDTSTPNTTKFLFKSELCLNDVNTGINCLNRRDGSLSLTADKRGMIWTAPTGYSLPDSTFTISAFAVSAECTNETALNKSGYSCERTDNPGPELARFNIDNSAPKVHVTGVNGAAANNGVNADNIKSTVISGTVDPDAASISLAIKSTGGGGTRIVPGPAGSGESITITPPAQGQTLATWTTSGLDLSTIPDGTLTIVATAIDGAGNKQAGASASDPDAALTSLMQARPSAPQNFNAAAGNGQAVLVWSAPASTGAADRPITSYSLTYVDNSVPGSGTLTAASPAGNATSAIVSNLQNGHTYTFRLAASNFDSGKAFQGGTGAAATKSATPKGNTAMAVAGPAHNTIIYGQSFTLTGKLTYFGVGLAGKAVTITSRYYNGVTGPTYHVTTDSNGHWAISGLKPAKAISYLATFAGDSSYNPSSATQKLAVRAFIKITKVTAKRSSHTSPVTIRGYVAPNLHGFLVYFYEVKSNGSLVKLGSARLSSTSTFAFVHTFSKGRHYVIAKFFNHGGNQNNQTGRVKIVRT